MAGTPDTSRRHYPVTLTYWGDAVSGILYGGYTYMNSSGKEKGNKAVLAAVRNGFTRYLVYDFAGYLVKSEHDADENAKKVPFDKYFTRGYTESLMVGGAEVLSALQQKNMSSAVMDGIAGGVASLVAGAVVNASM